MKFPESALAHQLLDGLRGIEIGGAAHNPFGLDTWNVDRTGDFDPHHEMYADAQRELCGESMPVDVVAHGDLLPFADNSLDFVVSSHVIEHFYDPIAALEEWERVARRYIFIICPQRDALEYDVDKPLTTLDEHRARHREPASSRRADDWHHSRWTSDTFREMCTASGYRVVAVEDPDTKAGNGFTIVIDLEPASVPRRAVTWLRRATRRFDRATAPG
jgi:SAM-dependent methyltransferase